MLVLDFLRERLGRRRIHLIGHIAGSPQVISLRGRRYMVFHLREFPHTVFHLKMLPTTPHRHTGDRVEITFRLTGDATAFVESVRASSDLEVVRELERGDLTSARNGGTRGRR